MNDSINVTFNDIGIIDGLHTIEVINADTDEAIGFNQSMVEEIPDEGTE